MPCGSRDASRGRRRGWRRSDHSQGISIDGEAVVELWVDDDTQSVAVNIFDRGVGQVDVSTIYDGIDVDITLDVGGTVNVGVGADHAYADRTCDAMYVTGADGVSRAYGVIESSIWPRSASSR